MLTASSLLARPIQTLVSSDENLNKRVDQLIVAERLFLDGKLSASAKIYKEISFDTELPSFISRSAAKRFEEIIDKYPTYNYSVELFPFKPKRKYSSDIVDISISGSQFPFTIVRNEPRHKNIKFKHALSNLLWHQYPSTFVDAILLQHTLSHYDNGAFDNHFLAKLDLVETQKGLSINYLVGVTYSTDPIKPIYENVFHLSQSNKNFDVGFSIRNEFSKSFNSTHGTSRSYTLSTEQKFKKLSLQGILEYNKFNTYNYDFNSAAISLKRPISILSGHLTLEHKVREDRYKQFPFSSLRVDHLTSINLSKQIKFGGQSPSLTFTAIQNHSTIPIYSYEEIQVGIKFNY